MQNSLLLRPHISLSIGPTNTELLGGEKIYRIKHSHPDIKTFFLELKSARCPEMASREISPAIAQKLYTFLQSKGLLTEDVNIYKNTPLEKQFDYFASIFDDPIECQRKLEASRLLILGCGGIGNIVVQNLLASGVSQFVLIDGDVVETTNFNRQFCFKKSDLGRKKVEALSEYILERNPNATVVSHPTFLYSASAFTTIEEENGTLFVCAADQPYWILQENVVNFCLEKRMPVIFSGVSLRNGMVGPLLTQEEECHTYLSHIREKKDRYTDMSPPSPSISYTNGLVGTALAREIVLFLTGHAPRDFLKRPKQIHFEKLLFDH